jgi:acyl carrier protein
MEQSEIITRLNPVFRETFDDDSIEISPEMVAADVDQWDSLNNIRLMVRIEEIFGITFDTPELTGLTNVGELIKTIAGKLGR